MYIASKRAIIKRVTTDRVTGGVAKPLEHKYDTVVIEILANLWDAEKQV